MYWINHNSSLILGAGVLVVAAFLLFRDGPQWKDWLILGGLVAVLFFVWLIVRPRSASADKTRQELSQIGAGVPVLVEIQSPY